MNKKEPVIEFNEAGHIYTVNGVRYPSVTEIIGRYLDPYGGVPRAVLENAGKFGNAVDLMFQMFLSGELDEDNLDEGLRGCLAAIKYSFPVLECYRGKGTYKLQSRMADTFFKFAGTPDLIIEPVPRLSVILIDVKSRPYIPATDILQLYGYKRLIEKQPCYEGVSVEMYILEILRAGEDGEAGSYRFVPVKNKAGWPMFKYLAEHFCREQEVIEKVECWKSTAI